MHPYNIDFIYSELTDNFDINSVDTDLVARDGIFEIERFMNDLEKFYNAVRFYVALKGILFAEDDELRSKLVEFIPDFHMKLKLNLTTGRFEFSADIDSVFDIAWYTLARMISEDPALKNRTNDELRPEGIMICCRNCGKFIIRKSNRQENCDAEECQKARNARKQKAYRDRKASKKAHEEQKNYR